MANHGKISFTNVSKCSQISGKRFTAEKIRCVGLFSHSDQQRAAQTLTCQYASASNKGAGGRIADALAAGLAGK